MTMHPATSLGFIFGGGGKVLLSLTQQLFKNQLFSSEVLTLSLIDNRNYWRRNVRMAVVGLPTETLPRT